MVTLGKPEVQNSSVEDTDISDSELPKDTQALFEEVSNDPDVQTPDMEVQGDWTFRTISDRIAMEERVNNNDVNWKGFKEVNWGGGTGNEEDYRSLPTRGSDSQTQQFNNPQGTPVNSLVSASDPKPFISLGEPAPSPDSTFATGDPGLGVNAGNNYTLDGRADNSSAIVMNGDVILSAEEGNRAVAFSPPGDASFMQMVNQRDWGHQAQAVFEGLMQMPGLGSSATFKAPSFNTADGPVALMTPYQYSYNRAIGLVALQPQFDVNVSESTQMTVALRQPSGEQLTSATLDVNEGTQSVAVTFLNAPPNGIVSLDTGSVAFTVENSEAFPPL